MTKYIFTSSMLFILSLSLYSQNSIDSVLVQIERNNATLSVLRKQVDAQKLANKTGIYIQNPELEFNYLWGNSAEIGNRTDFSIKQAFDFPTAYHYKNQISNLRNQQVDIEFRKQRNSIIFESRLICIDLVYLNALKVIYNIKIAYAQSIANAYKAKFEKGESNIIEFNKSQINLLNVNKEAEMNELERISLLSELVRLNGKLPIELTDSLFQTQLIPSDFEQWYKEVEQNNPVISWIKKEIGISREQEKLNFALGLPKFYAGYMSEKIVGQHFQGISAGITIPLWENKNMRKQSKAQTLTLQSMETDNKLQFYNQLKIQHKKAVQLQKSVNDYRLNLKKFDNSELLKKAFDKGEISLSEYILELTIYYGSMSMLLQSERELNKTIANLYLYSEQDLMAD